MAAPPPPPPNHGGYPPHQVQPPPQPQNAGAQPNYAMPPPPPPQTQQHQQPPPPQAAYSGAPPLPGQQQFHQQQQLPTFPQQQQPSYGAPLPPPQQCGAPPPPAQTQQQQQYPQQQQQPQQYAQQQQHQYPQLPQQQQPYGAGAQQHQTTTAPPPAQRAPPPPTNQPTQQQGQQQQRGTQQQGNAAVEQQALVHSVHLSRQASGSSKILHNDTIPHLSMARRWDRPNMLSTRRTQEEESKRYFPHIKAVPFGFAQQSGAVIPASPEAAEKFALPLGFTIRPLFDPVLEERKRDRVEHLQEEAAASADGGRRLDFDDREEANQQQQGSGSGGVSEEGSKAKRRRGPPPATPVPLVNFAELNDGLGVVRCRRQCRAYINPYVTFTDNGKRWQCNVCRSLNEVPAAYYCPVNQQTGLRNDIAQRPELTNAVCDFIAPSDYMVRPPQRPTFIFVLDVSFNAVNSHLLYETCKGLLEAVKRMSEDDDTTHIGFVAFDANIYLFNLRATRSTPTIIAAPDLVHDTTVINEQGTQENLELPALLDDLVVPLKEAEHQVRALLEKLPAMFAKTQTVECAFGPALSTAVTMINPTGGKIVATLSACPSLGEGRLESRSDEARKQFCQPKEHTFALPHMDWYKHKALACSAAQISVDLIVNASATTELASVAPISRYTGGHIYYVTKANRRGLRKDVERLFERDTGFEAVIRIRNSAQIAITSFFGHFYVRGNDLLALPVCDSDSAYSMQFGIAGKITAPVYVQLTLLYTTRSRERRIRVMTLCYHPGQQLSHVYNATNPFVTASLLAKMGVDYAVNNSYQSTIQMIDGKVIQSLKTFRQTAGIGRVQMGQLVLPQSLALLPLLLAGLYRCSALRYSSMIETAAEDRVYVMGVLMAAPLDAIVSWLAPSIHTLYSNSRMSDVLQDHLNQSGGDSPNSPARREPAQELCSSESLRQDSIYLVDLGFLQVVWVGRAVSTKVLEAFGIERVNKSENPSPNQSVSDYPPSPSHTTANAINSLSGGAPTPFSPTRKDGGGSLNTSTLSPMGSPSQSLADAGDQFVQTDLANAVAEYHRLAAQRLHMSASVVHSRPPVFVIQGAQHFQAQGLIYRAIGDTRIQFVTEKSLLHLLIEEDAREAPGYTNYLAQLQKRAAEN